MDFEVKPPKKRKGIQIVEVVEPHQEKKLGPKVLVQRVTQKAVSEYEAEILMRHGWEMVEITETHS